MGESSRTPELLEDCSDGAQPLEMASCDALGMRDHSGIAAAPIATNDYNIEKQLLVRMRLE